MLIFYFIKCVHVCESIDRVDTVTLYATKPNDNGFESNRIKSHRTNGMERKMFALFFLLLLNAISQNAFVASIKISTMCECFIYAIYDHSIVYLYVRNFSPKIQAIEIQ